MDGVLDVIGELKRHENTEECTQRLEQAISLYETQPRSQEALVELGTGSEATQALAMGVYCAFSFSDDIVKALRLAANHDGYSGSVASITGNILGAYLGKKSIPQEWLQKLQLAKEIEIMAEDIYARHSEEEQWGKRYPSW